MSGTQLRRWDIDERGHGIASGQPFLPDVARLADAMHLPDWITEDADAHLLPHIQRYAAAAGSPWVVEDTEVADAVLAVTLRWDRPEGNLGTIRADTVALIGEFAESSTHIRQRWTGDALEYDIATGMLDGDSELAPHGHLVRLRIHGPRVTRHG